MSLFDLFWGLLYCCTLDSPQNWGLRITDQWVRVNLLISSLVMFSSFTLFDPSPFCYCTGWFTAFRPFGFRHLGILKSSDLAFGNHMKSSSKTGHPRLTMVDSSNVQAVSWISSRNSQSLGFYQHPACLLVEACLWANRIFMTSWRQALFVDDQFFVDLWIFKPPCQIVRRWSNGGATDLGRSD